LPPSPPPFTALLAALAALAPHAAPHAASLSPPPPSPPPTPVLAAAAAAAARVAPSAAVDVAAVAAAAAARGAAFEGRAGRRRGVEGEGSSWGSRVRIRGLFLLSRRAAPFSVFCKAARFRKVAWECQRVNNIYIRTLPASAQIANG